MSTATDILASAEDRMKKSSATLTKELQTIRTGRANPALLDRVEVEYYGTQQSLKQVANVRNQDGNTLVIQPFDKSALKNIEQGIHKSDLGLTPNSDGTVIRINIPPLTEERRKDLTKLVKKMAEEQRIAIRNVRRDSAEDLKKLKGQLSEDDIKRQEDSLQKLTDKYVKEIDKLVHDKEAEVMEV